MKKWKVFVLAGLMAASTAAAVACSKEEDSTPNTPPASEQNVVTITLSASNNDKNVVIGGTKQLDVAVVNGEKTDVVYEIVSGPATVSATGLVMLSQEATVGAKVTVRAKIGETVSNSLELTVVEAPAIPATALTLTPSATTIAQGQTVTFNVAYTPANATTTAYTLSIDSTSPFAEITADGLKIKDSASPADFDDKEIRVKATLNDNSSVFAYAFITATAEDAVTFLSCDTVNFVANKDSIKSIVTEAYSWSGEEMNVAATDFTYDVADEDVATVDASGRITAVGHGSTTVTVQYAPGVSTECVVNVMVAPESIDFSAMNTHVKSTGTLHYGKAGTLNLGVNAATKTGYQASTMKVNYKFTNLDNLNATNVATVGANGITFNQTGRIEITVVSDSSIDGFEIGEQYEVKKSIIVDVNEGMNISTLAELKAYAQVENKGKIANILADLYVDDNNNFGDATNKYIGLDLYGSRTIQGNGYKISTENLSRGVSEDTRKFSFMHFMHHGNEPLSVAIYDLDFVGNVDYEGKHNDGTEIFDEQNKKNIKNNYYRAIEILGADLATYDAGSTSAILERVDINNVSFSKFYTALRLEHAVVANISNVTISNCYANGIENVQSHLKIKDVEINRVGAFGIEISSDDMRGHKAPTVPVSGTAGRQYNETATVSYDGYYKCDNLNNGQSSPYMEAFGVGGIVNAVITALVQEISSDTAVQAQLMSILYETVMTQDLEMNFSTLIFVNVEEFKQYTTSGNTENKFCEFNTTEKINLKTFLQNCLANPNYDKTEKKFFILDLYVDGAYFGASGTVNVGQLVLMNRAYVEK